MRTDRIDATIWGFLHRGWYPVPWAHHPAEIKTAIRKARFRPKIKCCFENCQRLIIFGGLEGVEYREGWITRPIPMEHAWLIFRGKIVDLTITDLEEDDYSASYGVSEEDILAFVIREKFWGPILPERLFEIGPWAAGFRQLASMIEKKGEEDGQARREIFGLGTQQGSGETPGFPGEERKVET